jgi:integrase
MARTLQRFNEPYLIRRRGRGFAFQIAVPLRCRSWYPSATGQPRAKIIEGLGTDSLSEARKLRDRRLAYWRLMFDPVMDITPIPPSDAPAPKPVRPVVRADGGLPFSEAAELYIAEVGGHLRRQTVEHHRSVYQRFQSFAGDPSISAVTRGIAADYLASRSNVSAQTRNGDCAALSAVFKWARRWGKMEGANPFSDQGFKTQTASWSPYTVPELRLLMPARPDDPLSWAIWIGAYSGMRLNEVGQLRRDDIKEQDGVTYFDVREGDGRLLKTRSSTRRVPVHSRLLDAGLLAYGFPPLAAYGPDQKAGEALSEKFTKWRRACGITRPHVSYHSLRGGFTTALDRAGVVQSDIAILLGHSRGLFGVYSQGPGIKRLRDAVETVVYEGL